MSNLDFRRVLRALLIGAATAAVATGAGADAAGGSALTVATLNVHYITEDGNGPLPWTSRRHAVAKSIQSAQADVIGFQEMETFAGSSWNATNRQRDFLADRFPAYAWTATGTPPEFPNTQPIMYRREAFSELDRGYFFFSETPDEAYSGPWVGRFSSFATWAVLQHRATGTVFYIYNVHLDSRHRENRRRAVQLLLRRIRTRERSEAPVIILGDFNAPRFFYPLRLLRDRGYTATRPGGATYHFNRGLDVLPGIDHVLASSELELTSTIVDRRRYGDTWPSDHYLVAAQIELP